MLPGRWRGWVRARTLEHIRSITQVIEFFISYYCIVPLGFLLWEIRVSLPGESLCLTSSKETRGGAGGRQFDTNTLTQSIVAKCFRTL